VSADATLVPPSAAPAGAVAVAPAAVRPSAPLARAADPGGGAKDAVAALLGGALLATVVFVGESGDRLGRTTTVVLLLLIAGGLAAATAVLRTGRRGRWAGAVPSALFFALTALSALSVTWAVNPDDAWIETNRTLGYAAAFAGAAALARLAPQRWRAVLGGILLATLAAAAYALLTKVLPEHLAEREVFARLREPYAYWNAVGLTGALAVPGCLWLGARREGRPLLDALAVPALALAVAVMLLAYSRGALLAALVGTALWFVLVPLRLRGAGVLLLGAGGGALAALWAFGQDALSTDEARLAERSVAGHELGVLLVVLLPLLYAAGLALLFAADARPLPRRTRRRLGIALLVGVALLPVAGAGALATTEDGLGGSLDEAWTSLTDPDVGLPSNEPARLTGVASERARYWRDATAMWQDRPAVGTGAGGFDTARLRYREDRLEVAHAHGFVVQTLADLGLAGLALALALFGSWVVAARRSVRAAAGAERAGLLTLVAVAVVFGTHNLVDWTWFVPGTAAVGLVAAGWVAGRGGGVPSATAPAPAAPAADDDGPAEAVAPARRGRRVLAPLARLGRPGARPYLLALGVVALTALAAWVVVQPSRAAGADDAAVVALGERRFDEARALVRTARDRNPLSVDPLFTLAAVEQDAGRPAEARRALEAAVDLQPANPQTWQRLAEYRLNVLRQPGPALEAARAAIFLDPRSFFLAQLYIDAQRAERGG
jgi:Flp pilus assembly pilin Flp